MFVHIYYIILYIYIPIHTLYRYSPSIHLSIHLPVYLHIWLYAFSSILPNIKLGIPTDSYMHEESTVNYFVSWFYWDIIDTIKIHLRCTTWFDIWIHCEMITRIKLINTSITSGSAGKQSSCNAGATAGVGLIPG